jgi:hypothetical protein
MSNIGPRRDNKKMMPCEECEKPRYFPYSITTNRIHGYTPLCKSCYPRNERSTLTEPVVESIRNTLNPIVIRYWCYRYNLKYMWQHDRDNKVFSVFSILRGLKRGELVCTTVEQFMNTEQLITFLNNI